MARGRARRASAAALAVLLLGCGGGGDGDGEQAAGDGAALASGPVVDLDPCDLLDGEAAAALSGTDVEVVDDAPLGTALGAVVGCSYRPSGTAAGGAIAASLVLGSTDEAPEAAKGARVAELTAGADEPVVEDIDLGDVGAVVTTASVVQVVYVVETVVVSVEVAPEGGVDDDVVEAVVDFTETTVEPVRAALEEKQRGASGATTTSTDDDGGDAEAAGGSGDVVEAGEVEGLWTGDWGTMAIEVDGDQVRAAYTHDEGRITGTFEDGVFSGRWTEIPSRAGPNDAGSVEFRFAKTGDDTIALDGRWDYDGDAEPLGHDDWDLTLSTDEVPEELLAAFDDDESFESP